MKNFVDMHEVSLRYGEDGDGTLALQNATMKVDSGEFVAVVGPSGCGKSTLMKVITGLWPPTAGGVIVNGKEVDKPLSITGMAFQNPTLLPWRTALDNVMLPLEIAEPHASQIRRQRAMYEAKARDLLALVGLKGFEDKFPWELSGGMQQRTSICRALIHDPSLLMLDEPFGALDMFTREELWLAMQELWMAQRPTVILVTHDLREAAFLADKIHVMSARPGQIVLSKTVDLPRPRDLDICFEPRFTDIVHELRAKIAQVRKA
jgi:NitT/TauT family transport system ATP-binding protein